MFLTLESIGLHQYRVDTNGSLSRLARNKWINVNLKKTKNGVWFENKKAKQRYMNLADIMLAIFVGERPEGCIVEYINGDIHDVRLENIRWTTKRRCTYCGQYKDQDDFYSKSIYCKKCKSVMSGYKECLDVVNLTLSEGTKGYLAGLIDGEGWIGMRRYKSKKSGRFNYVVSMAVGGTSEVIPMLQQEFCIGNIIYRKAKNIKHKNVFVWVLSANAMRSLLPLIVDYLRIKKTQASLAMKYLFMAKHQEENYLTDVNEIYLSLKKLNKRGVSIETS